MCSLRTKFVFNPVAIVIVCILQALVVAGHYPPRQEELIVDEELKGIRSGYGFSSSNFDDVVESQYLLPLFSKRNLEHLAKSSGGYLKKEGRSNKDKDMAKNFEEARRIVFGLYGKQKRGLYALAKNQDFPDRNKFQPILKEVSTGSYPRRKNFGYTFL